MSQQLMEKKSSSDETLPHPNYRLLLLKDKSIVFEHVERCLSKHVPGISSDKAHQIALKAQKEGVALVWAGPREVAEMYYEILKSEGLSVAVEPDQ